MNSARCSEPRGDEIRPLQGCVMDLSSIAERRGTSQPCFEDAPGTHSGWLCPWAAVPCRWEMARNQRLHDAIRQNGHRLTDLADEVGADPKTVERWISTGRLPRPAARRRLAELLGVPESVLWPDAPGVAYGTSELVGIYNTRRELPPATVGSLLDTAQRHVDVLAYAALWLWDTVPEFAERVATKSGAGANVRVCLGDPDSDAVALRGREEGDAEGMASRSRIAANYARAIQRVDVNAVRQSGPPSTAPCSGSTRRCS
jgi:transcriptional regulator with XRE-family HTH domain